MGGVKAITLTELSRIANDYEIPLAHLRAVLHVESNGYGFSPKTGRIIIQFEPLWMLRFLGIGRGKAGTWVNNGVSNQTVEWLAFNAAYKVSATAAMKSTSIGIAQIMGFHYSRLGFNTVGAFWDFCKESEFNQVVAMAMFIKSNPTMYAALKYGRVEQFAYYYNGEQYKRFNYDTRIKNAIELYT